MPTVMSASSLSAMNSGVCDQDYEEEVRGYKIAAMRASFLACLFFTLRVVFFAVTGDSPSLATSMIVGSVALAIVVGALVTAIRMAHAEDPDNRTPS